MTRGEPSVKGLRRGYDDFSQQMPLPSLAQEVPLSAYSGADGAFAGSRNLSSAYPGQRLQHSGACFPYGSSGSLTVGQQSGPLARGGSGGIAPRGSPGGAAIPLDLHCSTQWSALLSLPRGRRTPSTQRL